MTWPDRSLTVAALVILSVVSCSTFVFWRCGHLQILDFALYDWAIRQRTTSAGDYSPVVLIGLCENDIKLRDYPMTDEQLSQLLDLINSFRPRVIGLDLYRDLPEPRSGAEQALLKDALTRHTNTICIRRLPGDHLSEIHPPAALADCPERVGFNNFPVDQAAGNKVRRGLLLAGKEEKGQSQTLYSFPLRLALVYLEGEGIRPEPGIVDPEQLKLGDQEYARLRKNDGAYVNADDNGYQVLLDFAGPERFQTFGFSDLLDRTVPSAALRDKIVIIGTMAESVRDEFTTPLVRTCYGVELHARLVHQLTTSNLPTPTMRYLREWQEGLFAVLCCCLGVALGLIVRAVWLTIGSLVLVATLLLAVNQLAFREGWWIPIGPAAVAFLPATMISSSYRLQREWRERRLLMRLFSTHVSKEIAETLWEQRRTFLRGSRPHPQILTATVLFTDLEGFTGIAAGTDPQALMAWLNQYFDRMSIEILRRGGIINEYVGDGIMATFGIPVAQQADKVIRNAHAAVASALAMAEAMHELNNSWTAAGQVSARMRVGICTGPVVTGTIGSSDRMKYAVVGDTVNTAARLQSLKKNVGLTGACRVLVGESTWELVHDHFEGEMVGHFLLRGRQEKLRVHRVVGPKSQGAL